MELEGLTSASLRFIMINGRLCKTQVCAPPHLGVNDLNGTSNRRRRQVLAITHSTRILLFLLFGRGLYPRSHNYAKRSVCVRLVSNLGELHVS